MNHAAFARPLSLLALTLAAALGLPACKRSDSSASAASAPPASQPASPATPATQAAASPAATLPVISAAPSWQLTTLDGKPIGSEQLKGKVVVLDFWATWCGPCVHEIPGYVGLQKKYADRGLVIVGVSVDEQGASVVTKFITARGMNYPVALATPEIINAFGGVEAIPTTFLIDRDGQIRHRKVGAMDTADYEKLITGLL